jgi:hypothetical protein
VDYERALVGTAFFIESEMALFSERSLECASKLLDTADIVREAMFHQQWLEADFLEGHAVASNTDAEK